MPERTHAPALERVDARPFDLELRQSSPSIARMPRDDALRLFLRLRIGVPAELEVDAPDVVGLAMQQRRLVAMKRRIEPEPALGRKVRSVIGCRRSGSDRERPVPSHSSPSMLRIGCARRRRRSASRSDALYSPSGALIRSVDAVGLRCRRRRLCCASAARPARAALSALDQELLDPVLLQVDERRPAVTRARAAGRIRRLARRERKPCRRFQPTPFRTSRSAAAQAIEDLERRAST